MNTVVIGAKSPSVSRVWRTLADRTQVRQFGFAESPAACNCKIMSAVPQINPVGQYHFRTPSPGGQQVSSNTLLPTSFSGLARADNSALCLRFYAAPAEFFSSRRVCAHFSSMRSERLTPRGVGLLISYTSKGKKSWRSNQFFSRQLRRLALRPAVKRSRSARSSVVLSAQVPVPSRAAASWAVPQSALRATFLPASWKASTADALTLCASSNQKICKRRRAARHGGVLPCPPNSSEAPCSKNF